MALKIQLISQDGDIVNANPDPEGLNEFELELKRSQDHDGVFYEFGVNLKFFKNARRLIRDIYEKYGIDGQIECRIYEYNPNLYKNERIYTGKIRLQNYELDEIGVKVDVEQSNAKRAFMSQLEVDSETPTNENIDVPARVILQRLKGVPTNSDVFERPSFITFDFADNGSGQSNKATRFIMFDITDRIFNELDSVEDGGISYTTSSFDAIPFLTIDPTEQGLYDFDFTLRHAFNIEGILTLGNDVDVGASNTHTPPITIKLFFEVRDQNNAIIQKSQIGSTYDSTTAPSNGFGNNEVIVDFETRQASFTDIELLPNYRVYCYYEVFLFSDEFDVAGAPATVNYDFKMNADVGGLFEDFNFEVNAKTQYPTTSVEFTYPFELFSSLVNQYTGGEFSFKSSFFGRKDLDDYTEDGKGSLIAITNGHKLRQSNNKKLFSNFKEAFEAFNAIFCLGWGFELGLDGQKYVVIEEKDYFYNGSDIAITFKKNKNSDLKKIASKELYYSRVEASYPDFEPVGNTPNGIDEFNTTRKYACDVKQADNELKLICPYRASSYEIEAQRRQELNTESSKLDDENFIIYLKRALISGEPYVETGSSYTLENIFQPDTAFNIALRPSVFIENWRPVLSSVTLRRENKNFRFISGESNYELIVDGEAENRDIAMEDLDAIYFCERIEFEAGTSFKERQMIVNNPTAMIEVIDWQGKSILGYIENAKTALEERKTSFTLLRANRSVFKKSKIIKVEKGNRIIEKVEKG